jgi:hypothetical protein
VKRAKFPTEKMRAGKKISPWSATGCAKHVPHGRANRSLSLPGAPICPQPVQIHRWLMVSSDAADHLSPPSGWHAPLGAAHPEIFSCLGNIFREAPKNLPPGPHEAVPRLRKQIAIAMEYLGFIVKQATGTCFALPDCSTDRPTPPTTGGRHGHQEKLRVTVDYLPEHDRYGHRGKKDQKHLSGKNVAYPD